VTAVNDDDLVAYDEILVSAPLRIDFDQRCGHINNAHARRHNGPDAQREVDVVHARYVAASEDGLLDPRALLRAERDVGTSLILGSLTLGLALLRLTLLALLALRSLACGLTLLTTLALSLLALRGLPSGLISLRLALARLLLRLTAFAAALLVLSLLLSLLALHALVTLVGSAGCLTPLALILAVRLGLTLFALIVLALLGLAGGLIPLVLRLTALQGLTLLALVLRSALRLTGAALVAVSCRRAAFRLGGAAGLGARLFTARHLLG
jgi:hypothetical protein